MVYLGCISLINLEASCWLWLLCVINSLLWGTATVPLWNSEFALLLVSLIGLFFYEIGLSSLCPTPNLEGQWDPSLSGPCPSTCLEWVSLPAVQDSSQHSSRVHWGTQAAPPRQGGNPKRGRKCLCSLCYIAQMRMMLHFRSKSSQGSWLIIFCVLCVGNMEFRKHIIEIRAFLL